MKILDTNWRWPLVVLIGSTVLVLLSVFTIAICMLCLHIILERNGFTTDHVFYYVAMVISFLGCLAYLFPFFVFRKSSMTEEEWKKYYRIM